MGRYRSLQSIMLAEALKGITDAWNYVSACEQCEESSEGG